MIAQTIGRYTAGKPLESRINAREEKRKYTIKKK